MKKLAVPDSAISEDAASGNVISFDALPDRTFKDDYIFLLTDDTGMMQHSKYSIPDPRHGYTTDDNARALIMALMLYGRYRKKKYTNLAYRYSSFLLNAQNEFGKFRNFMGYDRRWLEEEGSEDCFGRCIWALGYALDCKYTPPGIKNGLQYLMERAFSNVPEINSIRARAYSILGLSHLKSETAKNFVYELAMSLLGQYEENRDNEWKWFESIVTYCNFVLPWSLIAAYRVTGEKRLLEAAEESLGFISGITLKEDYFKPVGCKGWLQKGKEPAEYDEQPVEACEGVLAFLAAYEATDKREYLYNAKKCHAWYEGYNSKGISLIDKKTGGCYDGLTQDGVNLNMGAESIISYVISYLNISSAKIL